MPTLPLLQNFKGILPRGKRASLACSKQWRTQNFRMGEVEVPQAPKGTCGCGEEYPPPHCAPSALPYNFFCIFVENTIF